ncbi:type II secretion system F family protein [Agromyces sp. MMS24-K17]|uniref:type II secretion system F family protein n=1 Tax=Agromyces sp. MMS24-K17 TaxID=3372850 RepID=UPI0037549C72
MSGPVAAIAAVRARFRRPEPGAGIDAVAAATERLAVLLAAGVPAGTAWVHLAGGPSAPEESAPGARDVPGDRARAADPVAAAARAAGAGEPVADAIAAADPAGRSPWRSLAAAWAVAERAGAPLATSLRDLAEALRDEAQALRDLDAALAGPKASARLVTALPLIAVGFGLLLGFDTAGVLLGTPVGIGCLALGSLLLWAGATWNRRLVARAAPTGPAAGIQLDLLAIAMTGGASVDRARTIVADALAVHLPGADAAGADEVIHLAAEAGAPVADLLRAEARRRRRAARSEAAMRAARLSVRLMLPLGACVLPAFVLLGVAPLMISVVVGTLGADA